MKANEFVRKYGLDVAKSIIAAAPVTASSYRVSMNNHLGLGGLYGRIESANGPVLSLSDLKRLIESHELVEYMGGIDKAKEQAYVLAMEVDGFNPAKVEKAITDVEACKGVL